ncbi:hypothetical protein PInf_010173 [Phytophthora infestans]|nr:hypothetical protein PInf_010173 [Phytophthora infestans]
MSCRFHTLLDTFDVDLTDAISSASANGHVDMMHRVVREIGERAANDGDDSDGFSDDSDEFSGSYESSYDSDDSSETDNGRISSSEDSDDDSQLLQPIGEDNDSDDGDFSSESDDFSDDSDEDSEDDDVEERMSKPIVGASDDGEARRDMHDTTWKVLNEAAAYGRFDVVQFAVNYAMECGYIKLYAASGEADTLTRAIAGHHDAVATYLLGMRNIQWDLDRASDKAIKSQRPELL